MTPLLQLHHVSKSFFDPDEIVILKEASLCVQQGQSVAIIGPSGSGKSTLLHLVGGIEAVDAGSILIGETPVTKDTAPRLLNTHVGYVFQSFHLLEDCTAIENVLMPATIARKSTAPSSNAYKRALSLLTHVGLEQRAHALAKHLSGGEKQRVAIARALCNDPALLLADEPTGNLDPVHGGAIETLLLDVAQHAKKGLLLVTHNIPFAKKCDVVYHLEEGRLCT